jgi:hypothetical protein
LNDVHQFHDSGQKSEGAPEGRVGEMPNHRQLRVALEQRKHGVKLRTKFILQFLLEAVESFDKFPKVECRPMVLPYQHIQERAVALITSLWYCSRQGKSQSRNELDNTVYCRQAHQHNVYS